MNPTILPKILGALFLAVSGIQFLFMSVWDAFGAMPLLLTLVVILILTRTFFRSHGQSDTARKSNNTEAK